MNDSEWIIAWMRYAVAALTGLTSRDSGSIAANVTTAARYADAMMEEHQRRAEILGKAP